MLTESDQPDFAAVSQHFHQGFVVERRCQVELPPQFQKAAWRDVGKCLHKGSAFRFENHRSHFGLKREEQNFDSVGGRLFLADQQARFKNSSRPHRVEMNS